MLPGAAVPLAPPPHRLSYAPHG